jgi:predicted TIM-barrel fold metal-dependent hydrolase
MIDCHAHVYPHLWEHFGLSATASEQASWPRILTHWAFDRAEARARRLQHQVTRRVAPSTLTVQGVARLRRSRAWIGRVASDALLNVAGIPALAVEGTADGLAESMARSGLSRTVVIAAPPVAPNEWLLDLVRQQPDSSRLVPVVVTPEPVEGHDEKEWVARYEALAAGGARGFKIHPNMEGRPASHGVYRAMFQVAKERNLFVILHTGQFWVAAYQHLNPADANEFESLFSSFPSVKVCLAHLNRDAPQGVWALMRRYDQLYADTSWQSARGIHATREAVGAERLLLGSDWPFLGADMQKESVQILDSAVNSKDFERMTSSNAVRFLGEGEGKGTPAGRSARVATSQQGQRSQRVLG